MLRTLRERANAALGNICEAAAEEPRVTNYAGNIRFFTDVVNGGEDGADDSDGDASDSDSGASDASRGDQEDAVNDLSE